MNGRQVLYHSKTTQDINFTGARLLYPSDLRTTLESNVFK